MVEKNMNKSITPVSFKNTTGAKLYGMLHSPAKQKKNTGIILLSPGIKSRVAPHRLYVKMANTFCDMGFEVLRFDPEGLGDSEGEIEEKFAADVYGSIQLGRFIDDTIIAMNWMEKECRVPKFIISGLCGGAITGLLTGAMDKRVEFLLGLGIPVILDSKNVDEMKYITEGQLGRLYDGYIKKIINPSAWLRFLSLKSDYRLMFKSLMRPFKKYFRENLAKSLKSNNGEGKRVNKIADNFNALFPKAFMEMASDRKIFLIFSGSDRLFWEFEEKFKNTYNNDIEKYKENFEIDVVEQANHIFSFKEWQQEMFDKSCSWLERNCN